MKIFTMFLASGALLLLLGYALFGRPTYREAHNEFLAGSHKNEAIVCNNTSIALHQKVRDINDPDRPKDGYEAVRWEEFMEKRSRSYADLARMHKAAQTACLKNAHDELLARKQRHRNFNLTSFALLLMSGLAFGILKSNKSENSSNTATHSG